MEKPKRVLYGATKTTEKSFCKYVDKLEKYCEHLEQQLKNCNLQNVSNRRELLIAYEIKDIAKPNNMDIEMAEFEVDKYLSNL